MEESLEYKVAELWVENDPLMKFIVKFDVYKTSTVIEGFYKIKLDGITAFKMLARKERPFFKEEESSFDDILSEMFLEIKEKVLFVEGLTEMFKNVDHVEIKNV